MKLSPDQVAALGYKAGWRGSALVIGTAIAGAESGYETAPGQGDPPHSPTDDYGVWQINHPAHPQYDVRRLVDDPAYNAGAAYAISSGGTTWHPWSTFNNGAYKAHMREAQTAVDSLAHQGGGTDSGLASVVGTIVGGLVPGLGPAVGGLVGGAAGSAAGDLAGAIPGLGVLADLLTKIASGELWRRLGQVLAGAGLVALGSYLALGDLGGHNLPSLAAHSVGEAAKGVAAP